ncbi:30S ribosomal protein S20, chloroplastic [Tanacetum coccineum]
MAAATAQCLYLSCRFQTLSLSSSPSSRPYATSSSFKPLTSSSSISFNSLSTGFSSNVNPKLTGRRFGSIVCEAGGKKPDSAAKRARQSEKRRLYNKARSRMVLEELDVLRKKTDAQPEEVVGIEKLIAEAYSVIDKAIQVGTLHRNTGARRKSRLARRKKAVEIHHGWYTPEPIPAATV